MSDQRIDEDYAFFFGLIGFIGFGFGVCIALFDLMHQPVLTALTSILFMFVGGACSMFAAGNFFHRLDKTYFMGSSNSSNHNHH